MGIWGKREVKEETGEEGGKKNKQQKKWLVIKIKNK